MQSTKELSSSFQASEMKSMAIDSLTRSEIDLYDIIHQALVKNIQSVFTSKSPKKTRPANQYHETTRILSEDNQSIIEFKQRLYNFISDMVEPSDSNKKRTIENHIKKIAEALCNKITSSIRRPFDNEKIRTLDLHEVLVLPSVSIENDQGSLQADDRVYFSKKRKQRRYDSLARLLSMRSDMSVCTAITIFNDELIISANCSSPNQSENIVKTIKEKLDIVRQAIAEVRSFRDFVSDYQFHQDKVNLLREQGGLFQPDFILIQALNKLIQTALAVEETPSASDNFSPEELNALLVSSNVTCLIPYEAAGENNFTYGIAIYAIYDCHDGSLSKSQFEFPKYYPSADISHFHAEQLIAFYLRTIKNLALSEVNEDAPTFYLGLSKLCCVTCSVLTHFSQLKLRGTSGDLFKNTVNLFADEFAPTISPPRSPVQKTAKKRKAYAEASPFSPYYPFYTDKKRTLDTDLGITTTSIVSNNSLFHTSQLSISPKGSSTSNSEFVSTKNL